MTKVLKSVLDRLRKIEEKPPEPELPSTIKLEECQIVSVGCVPIGVLTSADYTVDYPEPVRDMNGNVYYGGGRQVRTLKLTVAAEPFHGVRGIQMSRGWLNPGTVLPKDMLENLTGTKQRLWLGWLGRQFESWGMR